MENGSSEARWNDELRLVLIGKTGSGKSASGNTILGRGRFLSRISASSVTQICQLETTELTEDEDAQEGQTEVERRTRRVSVIDMPGFGDTRLGVEQIRAEIAKCVCLSAPGPHAFLLVVPIGRYTDSENQAVCELAKIFGENAVHHHTVVLFTRGDDLEGLEIDRYLRETAPIGLKSVIERCGGRYHVFNNRDPSNTLQVKELLMKVDNMVRQTNEGFYTNAMFLEAEAAIREEQRRMLGERGKAEGQEHENNGIKEERSGSTSSLLPRGGSWQPSLNGRWEAALSTNVLKRIIILLSAGVTGMAVGAVFGAAVPLAAAAGASLAGTSVAIKTAVTLGPIVGGVLGGSLGVIEGTEAASPREGAFVTFKKVSVIGVIGVGAALITPALSGAKSASAMTAGVANVPGAQSGLASVVEQSVAATVRSVVPKCVGCIVAGGLTVKVVKETVRQRRGTRDSSYAERTSYEIHWNK